MRPCDVKKLARYIDAVNVRDELNLTDRQKDVFNLLYLHGRSLLQIADSLNCSFSTIAHESSIIRKKMSSLPPLVIGDVSEE